MRMLICTQAVDRDDPTLGFFLRWIEVCAQQCERVLVICLFEGAHTLPSNVTVLSLGKEKSRSRARYALRFFWYIWNYRREYDALFVHMNQIYVLLGGLFWRLWGKRIVLWYAHGEVSFSLRLAEKLAHAVATSTPEGFRIPSKKVHVVGQGIEAERFGGCMRERAPGAIRIVYLGRISPVKRCETLIEAAALLRDRGEQVTLTFVGDTRAPGTERYYASLQELARERKLHDRVIFTGGVPHEHILEYLCAADIFVNPSATGSLDKAGLEGLASGLPLITCNPAFKHVLGAYADRLMFPEGDVGALAEKITGLSRSPDRFEIGKALARVVQKEHSLRVLVPRILNILNG